MLVSRARFYWLLRSVLSIVGKNDVLGYSGDVLVGCLCGVVLKLFDNAFVVSACYGVPAS